MQLQDSLGDGFKLNDIKMQGFAVTPDGSSVLNNKVIGIDAKTPVLEQEHEVNNQRSNWLLKVVEDSIHINCLNYANWDDTINYVCELFQKIFEVVPTTIKLKIIGVNFQVNDSFVLKEEVAEVDYTKLFNKSKYLTENIWESGSLWHLNSGWFSGNTTYGNELNVLNISTRTNVSENINLVVLIEHLQQYTLIGEIPDISRSDLIKSVFASQHANNKALVSELLSQEVKDKIGLT